MEHDQSLAYLLVGLLFASVLSTLASLSSVALARSHRGHVEELSKEGRVGYKRALRILDNFDSYLFSAQVAYFFSVFFIGILVFSLVYTIQFRYFTGDSLRLHLLLVFLCFSALIAIPLIVLSASQLGKAFAYSKPERVLCLSVFFIWGFKFVFAPLVLPLKGFKAIATRTLGLQFPGALDMILTTEELEDVLEMSGEAGVIEDDERELIEGAVTFSDTLVEELMTPRKDVICVSESASLTESVKLFVEYGFSRLLVIGEDLDDVKGIILAKDLIPLVGKSASNFSLTEFLRKPLFINGKETALHLVAEFRKAAQHFAVVLDEHGGVDGVATFEDLLEEIVGEIFDEFDSPEDEREIEEVEDGHLLVDGAALLDDLNEDYDLQLPDGDYDTVAGLVIKLFGKIPKAGEIISAGCCVITVKRVEQNRITQLRIVKEQTKN